MYPRNNASPERIAVGQVVLVADGTIQSAGVAITVRGQGGAEAASAGTIAYGADSTVYYTPTQAETDFTSFVVIASKAACFSVSQTIITTAASTPGEVVTDAASRTASKAVITATVANLIADHVLRRTWANAEASSDGDTISFRSLLGAVAKLVNRVGITGTDLLTYRDDDSTVLGTQALTTDASADPITGIDTT